MSNQRERSFHDFPREVHELKGRMEQVLPSYVAGLKRLSQLPEEFNHRFWASRLEALLAKVKSDYQKWQAQAQKADLLGKFMTLGVDVALKAGGMEPIPLPPSTRLGIAILPSGKIEPTVFDEHLPRQNAILVSIDRFEAVVRGLEDEIMKGEMLPESEEGLPRLVYSLALKLAKGSPE
jgi:hypothetical protein